MAGINPIPFLSIFLVYAINVMTCVTASPPVKGTYWPSWDASFPPSAIDTSLFTHVFYAFAMPNNVTFKFYISNSTGISFLDFTSTLHRKNPPVKALLSIGGGGGDPQLFARMASTASSRSSFIKSTIEVARRFGFDGLDLDWEFPESPKEMEDWGHLVQEWRAEVKNEAAQEKGLGRAPLLITAATYFSVEFFSYGENRKYPAGRAGKNLDLINLMCYDYRGSWDTSATGAQAALFDPNSNISTSYGVKSWINAGVPRRKLVMGLPLYGRTWKLKDPTQHGIGAPAVGVGPGDEGVLSFSEVEAFNKENKASVVYDALTVSTYSYAGTSWVGYDDTTSTAVKVMFARGLRLRGYFFWSVNFDSKWKISRQGTFLLLFCFFRQGTLHKRLKFKHP